MKRTLWTLSVPCLLLSPLDAGAQTISQFQYKLLPFQTSLTGTQHRPFLDGLKFLHDEEQRQRSLKGDISFGFNGDQAGEQSLFKLNTGASLRRGVFPAELRFETKLNLQLKNGQLQEDVTSLRFSYDYHTTQGIEYYAFAERFTDNFLSIQQRYEVGFGARFGVHLGHTDAWTTARDHLDAVRDGVPAARRALGEITPAQLLGRDAVAGQEFEGLLESVENLRQSFQVKEALAFVGLAVSIFAELERAELEIETTTAAGGGAPAVPERKKFGLDSTQRYRLTLRPTFLVRPAEGLELRLVPYFKLPLDEPRRVQTADGERLDYRRDVMAEAAWKIKRGQTGGEDVEFVLRFDHYFDNVPPSLPGAVVEAELAAGRQLARTTAESSHRVVSLALKVSWGG